MIEVYIDGASTGNPGQAGAGIFIKADGKVDHFSFSLGEMTSHEAEFGALIKALEICSERKYSIVSFRTDSKIVADTIDNRHAKREPFKSLLNEALAYIDTFELFFIKWIPSQNNRTADQLAKKAIFLNRK